MTKPNHRSEEQQQVGLYAQVTHPQRNNATQEVQIKHVHVCTLLHAQ